MKTVYHTQLPAISITNWHGIDLYMYLAFIRPLNNNFNVGK